MKGIYLAACKARHIDYDIDYQDIDSKYGCTILGDMLDIDLSSYDYVIATPPCNWWSKSNPYYWHSEYALKTRHLLPLGLIKLAESGKPFLLENVKNIKRMSENHIFDICKLYNIQYQIIGRHIYFSNVPVMLKCFQQQDFVNGGKRINNDGYNQGGLNVHNVVDIWLSYIHNSKYRIVSRTVSTRNGKKKARNSL